MSKKKILAFLNHHQKASDRGIVGSRPLIVWQPSDRLPESVRQHNQLNITLSMLVKCKQDHVIMWTLAAAKAPPVEIKWIVSPGFDNKPLAALPYDSGRATETNISPQGCGIELRSWSSSAILSMVHECTLKEASLKGAVIDSVLLFKGQAADCLFSAATRCHLFSSLVKGAIL